MNENQKQPPKQVIVMRTDLGMRKGKMVAQGAHASMKVLLDLGKVLVDYSDMDGSHCETYFRATLKQRRQVYSGHPDVDLPAMIEWLEGRFTKICVSVDSEEELLDIYKKATDNGLLCSLIQDAGLTEFGGVPTYTCVAVGPDFPEKVDDLTGKLKLL